MWRELPFLQRKEYRKLITNFASLSEAFAQKDQDAGNDEAIVSPKVFSKFQETAFQRAFNAVEEDIGNTSYDASIDCKYKGNEKRYLVGIKTFGINSGDQKIAQFKSISAKRWSDIINKIRNNAKGLSNSVEINKINNSLYLKLATEIAKVRNERIKTSEENIKGFKNRDAVSEKSNVEVETVYHVLMPTPKNQEPEIMVGETDYTPIDIASLVVDGCTTKKNPTNFIFHDKSHHYKYTSADSQLLMSFDNKNIVIEEWPVKYVVDALSYFENMDEQNDEIPSEVESHSWYIKAAKFSGPNASIGQVKDSRKNNNAARKSKIKRFKRVYVDILDEGVLNHIVDAISKILLTRWNTEDDKDKMIAFRDNLMNFVKKQNNPNLVESVEKIIYRTAFEFEIRIPNPRKFHNRFPNFFTGKPVLDPTTNKCIKDKKQRSFKLKFLPSGDSITAYIGQDDGKGIESTKSEAILGKWILHNIFHLSKYESLTQEKMNELEINGYRFTKREDHIELQFIWIDPSNEPADLWK